MKSMSGLFKGQQWSVTGFEIFFLCFLYKSVHDKYSWGICCLPNQCKCQNTASVYLKQRHACTISVFTERWLWNLGFFCFAHLYCEFAEIYSFFSFTFHSGSAELETGSSAETKKGVKTSKSVCYPWKINIDPAKVLKPADRYFWDDVPIPDVTFGQKNLIKILDFTINANFKEPLWLKLCFVHCSLEGENI